MMQTSKPTSKMNATFILSLSLVGIVIITGIAICLFNVLPSTQRQEFLSSFEAGVPEKHLIPDGYRGWIIVEHNVSGRASLPVEDGVKVFRYSEAGELHTSSRWKPGIKEKTFLFESRSGPKKIPHAGPARQIWGSIDVTIRDTKDGPIVARRSCYFVGTKKEYQEAGNYLAGRALNTVLNRQSPRQSN